MTELDPPGAKFECARQLQAIAQSGLAFARDPFDVERYEAVRRIAGQMMAGATGAAEDRLLALFLDERGYATPKVDVRGVVIRDGRILLVREAADGRWTIPGGWADVWRTPAESVAAEVAEESGYEVRVTRLLAVYDRSRHGHVPEHPFRVYKLFFRCEVVGGAPAPGPETVDVGFFDPAELPPLSLGRVVTAQIHRMFDHARDAGLPTDFD